MKFRYRLLARLAHLSLLLFLFLPHFHCGGDGDDGGGPAPAPESGEPQNLQVERGDNMGSLASLEVSWAKGENAVETKLAYAPEGTPPEDCDTQLIATTEESYTHFVRIPTTLDDQSHSFRACSVNADDKVTPGVIQTFTIGAPREPTGLQVTRGENSMDGTMTSLRVSWMKGANAAETRLAFALGGTPPADCTDPLTETIETGGESHTQATPLPPALEDRSYSFRACSVGEGGQITPGVVTSQPFTLRGPREPTGLTVTRGADSADRMMASLQISWTKGENAVETRLAYAMGATPPANCETTIEETQEESYTHSVPRPTTLGQHRYSFRACSVGADGQITPGETQTLTITVSSSASEVSDLLLKSPSSGRLELTWTIPTGTNIQYTGARIVFQQGGTAPANCNTPTETLSNTATEYIKTGLSEPAYPMSSATYHFRICALDDDGVPTGGVLRTASLGGLDSDIPVTVGVTTAQAYQMDPTKIDVTYNIHAWMPGNLSVRGLRLALKRGSAIGPCTDFDHKIDIDVTGFVAIGAARNTARTHTFTETESDAFNGDDFRVRACIARDISGAAYSMFSQQSLSSVVAGFRIPNVDYASSTWTASDTSIVLNWALPDVHFISRIVIAYRTTQFPSTGTDNMTNEACKPLTQSGTAVENFRRIAVTLLGARGETYTASGTTFVTEVTRFGDTSASISGLTASTTYYFAICAIRGTESEYQLSSSGDATRPNKVLSREIMTTAPVATVLLWQASGRSNGNIASLCTTVPTLPTGSPSYVSPTLFGSVEHTEDTDMDMVNDCCGHFNQLAARLGVTDGATREVRVWHGSTIQNPAASLRFNGLVALNTMTGELTNSNTAQVFDVFEDEAFFPFWTNTKKNGEYDTTDNCQNGTSMASGHNGRIGSFNQTDNPFLSLTSNSRGFPANPISCDNDNPIIDQVPIINPLTMLEETLSFQFPLRVICIAKSN